MDAAGPPWRLCRLGCFVGPDNDGLDGLLVAGAGGGPMGAFVFVVVDVRGLALAAAAAAAGVLEVSPIDDRLAVDPVSCFVGDFTGD